MKSVRIIIAVLLMLFSAVAVATNGYFSTGYGSQSKGMAGAGVAHVTTALGGVANPALLVHVGDQYDLALSAFRPPRGFVAEPHTPSGPYPVVTARDYRSKEDLFLAPSFAYNRELNAYSTLGISVTGSGMSTEYDGTIFDYFYSGSDPTFIATAPAGIELMQLHVGVPYSVRIDSVHSVGITPILSVQSFKATGGEPFRQFSIHPDAVTNNGRSWSTGLGIRFGWLGEISDRFSIGASYQPRTNMSEFEEYKGLFAEEGDFDIPSTLQVGVSYQATPALTLVADYQRINYGDIRSLANSNGEPLGPSNYLGQDSGIGGGWVDAKVMKLGLEWRYSDRLTLRAGYSHSNDLIPASQTLINIVAPVVNDEHFSLGATYEVDKKSRWNFSLTHAPKRTISGYNPNTGGETGQQGSLYMEQTEFEISYTWEFD